MLKKISFASLAVIGLLVAGCGGDGTDGGGGSGGSAGTGGSGGEGGSAGNDLAGARLKSGTYTVTNIVKVKDDCGLALEEAGAFPTTQIVNTGDTLAIGTHYSSTTTPVWDPAGYAEGSGTYTTATTATLTTTAHVTITTDNCEYDTTRTSMIVFTGNNAVSVDFTDHETNQNAKCTDPVNESTMTCDSHYTFDLSM